MPKPPEVLSLSSAHAIAVWGNVLVQIWERVLSSDEHVREFERALAAAKRMRTSGFAGPVLVLTVVSVNTNIPDSKARALGAESPAYFDYYVGVHEGSGFRASLVRTVVLGMALAARVRARYEVAEDLDSGCLALASHSAGTVDAAELRAVVDDLRQEIAKADAVQNVAS